MRFDSVQGRPPSRAGYSRGERIKLLVMAFAFVLVLVVFVVLQLNARRGPAVDEDLPVDTASLPVEQPYVPEVDPAALDRLVEDDDPAERVVLESEGVDAALELARRMTRASYDLLDAAELDEEVRAELAADPAAHRGRPLVARGWIEDLRTRRRGAARDVEHVGRLALEDGGVAHFVALRVPEGSTFVRVDGLFLKQYSQEDRGDRGRWLEGPLLVASEATPSWPSLGEVTELDPGVYERVEDDSIDGGISGLPFEAVWQGLAWIRDLPEGAVDWDAAPELDRTFLNELLEDGEPHRMRPVRIPVSRLQAITRLAAGENPARLETFTSGWIGNTTWKNLIHFRSPFAFSEFDEQDFVSGRGFFLKNFAYEPRGGQLNVAPVVLIADLERYEPPRTAVFDVFAWTIAGVTVGLIVLFSWLLTKDRRRAQALQERLVERRRARRGGVAPSSSTPS